MKITFVRHAQTEQNYLEVCQGLQNNPLCDDGRRQALKLKEKLKDKHFDYCYMSPMLRTVETAIILIGDRVETIPDKRIIERNLGDLENVPRKFYDYKKYWDYNLNSNDRGVEPVQDIFNALKSINPDDVKVILLGQDPYPGEGMAHGYSFSVSVFLGHISLFCNWFLYTYISK